MASWRGQKTEKPYHHGELREALVAAGRKLLEEKGLRGFTLRECARRAQVSHAAPAHHFASIDDLLAEIATRGYHDLAAAMTAEARALGRRCDGAAWSARAWATWPSPPPIPCSSS